MEYLKLNNIKKTFSKNKFTALENVNLTINESEFICLLGPSGCGKSTILRMIAGLESPTSGTIMYKDKPITGAKKEIGMVFQNYSLMPWLNVLENIALGPKFSGKSKNERMKIAKEYLELINMSDFGNVYPYELSGGMQQRVAIARALANKPDVLLMDEPFGALDAYTRIVLQKELLRIWEKQKITIIFVTHSVDEAVYLADKVYFMKSKPGKIYKEIPITIPRERERNDPLFGELTTKLLDLFEENNN
ncbi:ABC transporter ATP-binding protein [Miniphocaeibacter halophilus]|uniref:ABC transporter ATP-binding protein n=1 Tax=Miniphocaeibacter halophilus TaxID=2931922 RepID=A0AC61MR95_9FIRM|nr:ABC transporter ATP-binding protein [Miniphocaeibacter halophilus]QQK06946.1 ABC transporter ATP-binding protein [Miniphocaeibacter halophilus]